MTTGSTKQYIGVIDMLCEGPIQGLVDGSKTSVYINDVPFETADVVGSLTTSSENIFGVATLDCSGTSVTDVQGFTVTESDIGKFILVDVKSCPVNVTFQYNEMIGVLVTLTGSDSNNQLTSDYTTTNDNTSFVRIASSSRASIERDITVNSSTGNGSAIVDAPGTATFQFWDTAEAYTVTLVKAVKIATVDEANNTFTIESSISSSALNNVKFIVQDARAEDSDSFTANSQSTISKVDGSTVQFRNGELYQSAVTPVHSLSGGISISGAGNPVGILQSNDDASPDNQNYGFTSYDTTGYPTGQSFANNSGPALIIPSSGGTGPNFNLTTAQRSQVDEVNIRINYGTLITYDNTSGDKSSANAIYVFQIALNRNGSWSDYNTLFSQHGGKIVHSAKTTAPVSFGHTIGLTRFKPFDDFRIRIIRLTRPSGLPVWSNGSNGGKTNKDDWTLQAESQVGGADLTSTIKDNLTYPYTANAAVSFSSKSYSSLPTRSYLLQGKKVRIPSSYTPREYTEDGIAKYDAYWDGTFKTNDETGRHLLYYTDNPAWVFYDILTNDRYGVGKWIDRDVINKFSLYRISKYCDELVDDGTKYSGGSSLTIGNVYKIKEVGTTNWTTVGAASNTVGVKFTATSAAVTGTGVALGQEPRFRANLFFTRPTEVYKVLKDMATVFLGMLYWLDGKITPVQDVPGEPVYTFSKSNTINGIFNYETSGRKTRANQVVVTWNDPKVNYEQVPLIVEDRNDIVAQGRLISENAVAMGATSEGQALRYGRWKLWTAQNQTEIVSFQTGLQGAYIRPGDIINIQDRDRYGVDFSGLVKSFDASTGEVTFDRPVTSVSNASTFELNTVVTNFAPFYTGLEPLHIDNSTGYKVFAPGSGITTFNRGDRFTSTFWYPDATPDVVEEFGSTDLDLDPIPSFYSAGTDLYDKTLDEAEKLVSNAFVLFAEAGGPVNSTGSDYGSGYNYEPLPLDWKEHTYVVKTSGTLNNDRNIFTPASAWNSNEYPADGTVWALYSEDSAGRDILGTTKQYRVLTVAQNDEKNTYEISAVEHYNVKYDAVDKDYALGETPENVFPTIEDTDEDVPAPGNIYVVLKTDSTKRGEEFDIEWTTPQESYIDSSGTTRTRDYSFFSEYEFVHNVPGMPSPLRTTRNSIEFTGVPDGQYVFRVRTVSRKQNYSRYASTEYGVDDPFATDVERVVGGLPKGLIANSTFYSVTNTSETDYRNQYKLEWERSSPKGHSVGSEFTLSSQGSTISTSLQDASIYGLVNNGFPRMQYTGSLDASKGVDQSNPDEFWHYLLFDGGTTRLASWNNTTLDGLPFMFKIPELGTAERDEFDGKYTISGYRGASQNWSYVGTGTLPANSNKLTMSSTGSIELRDIIHFDGIRAGSPNNTADFGHHKIEELSINSTMRTLEVELRPHMEGNAGVNLDIKNDLYWVDGDGVSFERIALTGSSETGLNGNHFYVHVDYHNGLGTGEKCLVYKTYEAANDPASVVENAGSFTVGEEYTIRTVGSTNFTAIGAASNTVGVTFTATGVGSGTGTAIASKHLVSSTDLGGTYEDYSGYIYRSKVKAAKVTAIIDNTTVLLDRSFDEALSTRNLYRLTYRPGYNNDAIFGRVKWDSYNSSTQAHQFLLDKFITIDEGLVVEGLQVEVTPSVSVLQYNGDGTSQTTNVDGAITVRVDAMGFKNPQFRIIEIDGSGGDIDYAPTTLPAFNDPTSTGGFFYTQEIANETQADDIDFENGVPVTIRAEVREAKAIDINAYGTGQITKVTSGSDGTAGKTVHLLAEDYSIIYDESGLNPLLNGNDTTITFTAEAFNFTDPVFKWTFTGSGLEDSSAFTTSDSTQSGYTWGTFKDNDTGTGNDFISTATIQVPTSYDGNWGNNQNQRQFSVKVEVAESSSGTPTTEAFDEISVIGIHALKGGYWAILSNPSHTVVTNVEGKIVGSSTQSNTSGFITAENSGTTLEVGRANEVLTPYQGTLTQWNALSYSDKEGKYFVVYTETNNAYFNKGTISYSNNIITIGDHEFSKDNWNADTAALGFQILLEGESSLDINLSQGFSKSKQGFGGISVINTNTFESLPTNSVGRVADYTNTATTINAFLLGISLPYYDSSTESTAIATDNPTAYWEISSVTENDITAGAVTAPPTTNATTRLQAASIAKASNMTANTASLVWKVAVYIKGADGTYNSEIVDSTQTFTKTLGVEDISASLSTGVFLFDEDSNVSQPSGTTFTLTARSSYRGIGDDPVDPYITYEVASPNSTYDIAERQFGTHPNSLTGSNTENSEETKTTSTQTLSRPNYSETDGTINYPLTMTTRLYDWDGTGTLVNDGVLLDFDTVSLSAVRSPADNVVIELTNDNETLGAVKGANLGDGNSTIATTTANIYIGGTQSNTGWTFSASALSGVTTNRDANNGELPSNTLNITQVNSTFTNGTITITATHDNNEYSTQQAVFSLSRINGTNTFRIVPDQSAITFDPNTNTYSPSNATVTFTFKEIKSDGTSANFSGRYEITGKNGIQSAATSVAYNFSDPNDDGDDSDKITTPSSVNVKLYPASGTATLLDEETVPLILGGADGTDGIVANLTAERAAVSYSKNAQNTYDADVSSVALTVDTSGITNPGYSWTGTSDDTQTTSTNAIAFGSGVTLQVASTAKTASCEITGQNSDGQAITAIQKSITIGTSVGAVGSNGVPGKRSVQAYIYYQSSASTAPTVPSPLSDTFSVNFNTGAITSSDTDWSTTAPVMTAGNANKYWYFNFIATEAGTYNNGYPDTNMNSSPSPGEDSVQSLGFTGLVTFTSNTATLVSVSDGSQTISFGSQGTTKIDGGNISTGTIQAQRISLSASQVGAIATGTTADQIGGQTPGGTTTQIQQQAVTVANKYTQITAAGLQVYLKTQTYQTDQTYSTDQADTNFRTSNQVTAAIQAQAPGLAPVQSVNGQTGAVTGIGGDDLSATDVSAGKIVLTSGTLKFTDSTNTAQYQPSNSIVLDTTSGNNSIRIYDGTNVRVKIGAI